MRFVVARLAAIGPSRAQDAGVGPRTRTEAECRALGLADLTGAEPLRGLRVTGESRMPACLRLAFDRVDALEAQLTRIEERFSELETRLGETRSDAEEQAQLLLGVSGQLAALREARFVPPTGEHPDSRAVIAYTGAPGARPCPPGWRLFEEAGGRFPVGAGPHPANGLRAYTPFGLPRQEGWEPATGGAEAVVLTEPQMPRHKHDFTYLFSDLLGLDTNFRRSLPPRIRSGLNYDGRWQADAGRVVGYAGGNQSYENRPPWIALHFCVKDD